jgi:hypothetical protein
VATIAHELGHVILLGRGLMSPKTSDHEPMTDLLSVFLGLGIFNANSANRFKHYQDERRSGWSMQRLGYLTEEIFGKPWQHSPSSAEKVGLNGKASFYQRSILISTGLAGGWQRTPTA